MSDPVASGVKLSKKEEIDAIMNGQVVAKATTQQKQAVQESDSKFAKIEANPFFKVAFSAAIEDSAKPLEVQKLVEAADTVEDLAALEVFKAYMSELQIRMASEVIKMSDPTSFAMMRDVVDEMNVGLQDINEALDPLVDILDAFEEFGDKDDLVAAFTEIQSDRKEIVDLEDKNKTLTTTYDALGSEIQNKRRELASVQGDKNWFGQQRADAKRTQAILEFDIAELERKQKNTADEQASIAQQLMEFRNSSTNKLDDAKRKLREMLDTDGETHTSRGQALIDKAIGFIEASKKNADAVIDKKSAEGKRISNLDKVSRDLTKVFTIIDEGSKGALGTSLETRQSLEIVPQNETAIEKINRETKLRKMNEKIDLLNQSTIDTNNKIVSLAANTIMIDNMKQQNRLALQQINEIRAEGVATVASNLSTISEAIGAAATSQAKNVISATMNSMNSRIDKIAGRQSIKTAMSIQERDAGLRAAVERLSSIGAVKDKANQLAQQGLAALRKTNEDMAETARKIREMQAKAEGAVAESLEDRAKTIGTDETATTTDGDIKFPFSF